MSWTPARVVVKNKHDQAQERAFCTVSALGRSSFLRPCLSHMGGHHNVSSILGQTEGHLEPQTRPLKPEVSAFKAPEPQALAVV